MGTGARTRLLAATLTERFEDLAGVTTAILEGGEGPAMVLLHGRGEHWGVWLAVLDDLLTTHRVVIVDLPGHGGSTTVAAPLDRANVVTWVDELLDWEMPVDSVDHLIESVLSSNPIAGQLFGTLTDEQFTDTRQVLDGMLRERSGGAPGAVLHTEMNLAVGTA